MRSRRNPDAYPDGRWKHMLREVRPRLDETPEQFRKRREAAAYHLYSHYKKRQERNRFAGAFALNETARRMNISVITVSQYLDGYKRRRWPAYDPEIHDVESD